MHKFVYLLHLVELLNGSAFVDSSGFGTYLVMVNLLMSMMYRCSYCFYAKDVFRDVMRVGD